MITLTKANFDETIAKGKVLVDFGATWCGYCRIMAPVVSDLADKYNDTLKVFKVDVDADQDLTARYDVAAFPTFILFQDGAEVARQTGASSVEELERMLAQ